MKASDFVEALEKFFLDIIGTVLPGGALIIGIAMTIPIPTDLRNASIFRPEKSFDWILLIAAAYAVGHALTNIGERLQQCIEAVAAWGKSSKKPGIVKLVPKFIVPDRELFEKMQADPIVKAVTGRVIRRFPELESSKGEIKVTSWRNVAMSIAPDQRHTVYRFMFLSLFNMGMGSVSVILLVLLVLSGAAYVVTRLCGGNGEVFGSPLKFTLIPILLLLVLPFFERRYRFFATSMQTPFSIALVGLADSNKPGAVTPDVPKGKGDGQPVVYLAGGFRSGWQDKVKMAAPQFRYLDPRSHGLKSRAEYTSWDLEAIRRCDYVFAYLESTNPGGYSLALEVGYAKALNKLVVVVDEKSASDAQTGVYLEMVGAAADVVFDKLEPGLEYLKHLTSLS